MAECSIKFRSKTSIWLIGSEEVEITGSKLPSNKQVLSVFFHHHKTLKKTIHKSAMVVVQMVATFWNKACIPVQPEHHAVSKLEKLREKWVKLKKNANRKTETQQQNETDFVDDLDNLFDIAHLDALNIIKIQEDKDFLLAQREKSCHSCMGPVDMALQKKLGHVKDKKLGLPVILSCVGVSQLVRVPKLHFGGTGEAQPSSCQITGKMENSRSRKCHVLQYNGKQHWLQKWCLYFTRAEAGKRPTSFCMPSSHILTNLG